MNEKDSVDITAKKAQVESEEYNDETGCILISMTIYKIKPSTSSLGYAAFVKNLDGVGPVDNRPSTKYLHQFVNFF